MISFLFTPLMAIELLISEFMFSKHLEKRNYFYVRLISGILITLALTIWIEIIYTLTTSQDFIYNEPRGVEDSIFKFIYYLLIYISTVFVMFASFKAKFTTILFYSAGGYALQHISSKILILITLIPGYPNSKDYILYLNLGVDVLVTTLMYTLSYFIFIKRAIKNINEVKNLNLKVYLSIIVIIICIGLSRITTDNPSRNLLSILSESLYAIISCILVLTMLLDISEKDKIVEDNRIMLELLRKEKEQYKLSKENIAIMNIKYHDLKHIVNSIKKDGLSEDKLKSIEQVINVYDSNLKTGNDVVDIILTEKQLLCKDKNILFTSVINGKDISFMDSSDAYSLFGNALNNAIESVSKISDPSKRVITLNMSEIANMLSIHIENYFIGTIEFKNGLPVTKGDKNYHGFGMKSIELIVKQYHGELSASTKDDIFTLDIIIPIPSSLK